MVTGDATASFVENSSSAVASYTGTDPERDTLTWTVSGSDFWISDRGQLYFRSPPSYEQRTSYTVTVTAEDDGGLQDSLSVTVTVTDVEEDGVVTLSPLRGWERNAVHGLAGRRRRPNAQRYPAVGSVHQPFKLDGHRWRDGDQLYGNGRRHRQLPAGHRLLRPTAWATARRHRPCWPGGSAMPAPRRTTLPEFADCPGYAQRRPGDGGGPVHRLAGAGDGSGFGRHPHLRTYRAGRRYVRHRHGDGPASDEGSPRLRR